MSISFYLTLIIRHTRLFVTFFFLSANLLAQQYQYVYYTPRDGLVNSRVRSIKQDTEGRMYFLTYGGLSVYDGVKFTNYRQKDGLANELVNDIVQISPDSLLVATNAPLLNTLVRGKIGIYQTADHFYPVTNRFLKSNDGVLYAVADDGLFRIEGNRFVRIPLINDKGKDLGQNLDRITEWNQFLFINPWNLLQDERCIIYDRKNQKLAGVITQKRINITAVSPAGELWLNSPDGIETLDLASLQKGSIVFKPLASYPNAGQWKNSFIYFDDNNGAWLYLNNEVIHIPSSGNHQTFSPAQGLKTSNLSDIFVDREGITWMASDGNGVVKMPGTNVQILNDMIPGTDNHFSAIYQKDDTTWMFNMTDNSFYRIHHDQLTAFPLKGKPILVNNLYTLGSHLYFTANNEINLVESKDKATSYAHPRKIFPDTLKVLEIGIGLVDPNGFIIQNVRQDDSTFYLMAFYQEKLIMKYPLSFALDQMAIDREGHLLIPTRDNHLFAFTLHPETPGQYFRVASDYSKEIEGMGPRSVTSDSKGNIWIGTRYNGVYCMEMEDKKVRSAMQLTTEDGLTDDFLYQLYCDPDDHIWAGSQTGLDKITFRNGEYIIENITKSKNIFQGIYKIINAGDGIIWAMTSNGNIIKVSDPPAGRKSPDPFLFITKLSVNDIEFPESHRVFSHVQNNLSISVAAPSFLDEKSILYSYQLKGSGKISWSIPSNNAHFNFINLAPGHYTLNVKAEFPGKIYPAKQLKYSFFIRPPFWQQWWFIALAWITILACLGLIVRYYYNRKFEKQKIILERKQAIEKERTRIATDMHDDLGAGLSRIKFLSETIGIKKQMNQPIESDITNIRHFAHEMIDKMGEIVWALNEKNDSLSDLLSYTRAYAVEYLAENGIQSHIEKLPPFKSMMVNGEFRRNIYLSVKEALHNIIKHARANEVSIQFQLADKLVIHIQDDGVGLNGPSNNQYANGLNNMKKRMSDIGGSMEIRTNHGTQVVLTAPLPS